MGDEVSNFVKLLKSPLATTEGTLLKTPIWNPVQGAESKPGITLNISLINDIEKMPLNILTGWIFRNYRFMQNFMAGIMPVSMYNSVMQPPNLYRVIILGKCYFHWASITAKVDALGKQKKIPAFSKFLHDKYDIKSINENTLWPEIWKLTLIINDLMPMSFTTYIDYLMNLPWNTIKRIDKTAPNDFI